MAMTKKEKIKTILVWCAAAAIILGYCLSDAATAATLRYDKYISWIEKNEQDNSEKYSVAHTENKE